MKEAVLKFFDNPRNAKIAFWLSLILTFALSFYLSDETHALLGTDPSLDTVSIPARVLFFGAWAALVAACKAFYNANRRNQSE